MMVVQVFIDVQFGLSSIPYLYTWNVIKFQFLFS